jgi:membrane dipeptidase
MIRTLITAFSFLSTASFVALAAWDKEPPIARARRILDAHPVVDGHNDLPWKIREITGGLGDVDSYELRSPTVGQTDIERLRAGGVGGQFWSVYVPAEGEEGFARFQLEQIDLARRMIARYPDDLFLATSASDIERAIEQSRVASLLGIEGGHAIENSLGALRAYHDLGVRYMTLTHSTHLDWADSSKDEPPHGGLTPFGEEVVREMNRLGMLVDLSHTSPETMADALRVSRAPVIFSHSSARALCDHPRNVPDAILKELSGNGGVVMVTFVAAFISPEYAAVSQPLWKEYERRVEGIQDPAARSRIRKEIQVRMPPIRVTIAQVADHVEHVRSVAGIDHVGLGGDFDGNDEWPEGLEDVSGYPRLFAELLARGWSEAELSRLANGNILRVFRQAEAVARRLRQERPASTSTFEELEQAAEAPWSDNR